MKLKSVLILIFLAGQCLIPGFTMDWKALHEKSSVIDLTEAKERVKSGPDSVEDLYLLGLAYLNAYLYEDAEKMFLRILAINPDNVEARWGYAEILRCRYVVEKSRDILNEVVALIPDFSPAYISLAYIAFNEHDYQQAVKLSLAVIKQGQKNADQKSYARAYLIFAGAKGMIAHYGGPVVKIIHGSQIFPNLKKAQRILPDSAEVFFGLGAFYLLAPPIAGGDIDKAEEHLKKAIEIDPVLADAYVRLAQVYKVKGDLNKFEKYLDKSLEIDPGNVLAKDIKGKSCAFICIDSK